MVIRQQLLRPTGVGVPSGPIRDGLDLWTKSDRSNLGVSGARLLNGVDQYFQLENRIDFALDDFCLWFWLDSTDNGTIFRTGENSGITIQYTGSTLRTFIDSTGGTRIQYNISGPSEPGWYFYLLDCSRSNQLARFWINAVADAGVSLASIDGLPIESDRDNTIGALPGGGAALTSAFARAGVLRRSPTEQEIQALFNFGAGLTFSQYPEPLKTDVIAAGHSWNALEATGNLLDATGKNNGTEINGPIGSTAGPRVAQLVDTSGNDHNGSLVGLDEITSWKSDNADQTYSFIKNETISGKFGRMVDFADIDAAHITADPPLPGRFGIEVQRGSLNRIVADPTAEGAADFTVDCFVQFPTGGDAYGGYFFARYDTANARKWGLFAEGNTGNLIAGYSGNGISVSEARSTFNVADGNRHHIAATFALSGVQIWVDGVLVGTGPAHTGLNVDTADLTFGGVLSGGNPLPNRANFIVWNPGIHSTVLSEAQIQSRIADGTPEPDVSSWPFTEPRRSLPHVAGGLSIDGAPGGGVAVGSRLSAELEGPAISFAGWILADSLGLSRIVHLTRQGGAATKYYFRVLANSLLEIYSQPQSGDVQVVSSQFGVLLNHWVHVGGFIDVANNQFGFYLDGFPAGSGAAAFTSPGFDDSSGAGYLLSSTALAENFQGLADYLTLYPSRLSDTDFSLLAKGLDPIGDIPEAVWPADDGPQGPQPQDGDIITTLTSSEGRNLDFYGTSAAQRPIWRASEPKLNGRPTLSYDGLDDCLEHFAKVLDGSEGTIQIAQLWETGAMIDGGLISQGDTGIGSAGAKVAQASITMDADGHQAGSIPADAFKITTITCNGSQYSINGSVGGTGTWWDAIAAAKTVLGAIAGATNSGFSQVLLPEVLIYNRVLTAEEITHNNDYLGGKYS